MGTFFEIKTPADQILMDGYDQAVLVFRAEVSRAMEETADQHPSLAPLLRTAAEALRLRPLPSEVNSDTAALRRLALSSLTIEMMFAKMQVYADSQEALDAAARVALRMREIGSETTGRAAFKPLTAAAIAAVSAIKPEIAREMDEKISVLHLEEIRKSTMATSARKPDGGIAPRPPGS